MTPRPPARSGDRPPTRVPYITAASRPHRPGPLPAAPFLDPPGWAGPMAGGPEPILLSILIIILGAKVGGELAERFKQPAVLGELLIGVLLAASLLGGFVGMPDFSTEEGLHEAEENLLHAEQELAEFEASGEEDPAREAELRGEVQRREGDLSAFVVDHGAEVDAIAILGALATIGVILLLFEVGLESDVRELTRVGVSSVIVAVIGVVASFAVGYAFSYFLSLYWAPWQTADEVLGNHLLHLFVGAALTATSVGITARVLGDMGRLDTNETKIILGAAVIDDIAGLIILAIVAAMVAAAAAGTTVDAVALAVIAAKAVGFLVVALVVGLRFIPRAYDGLVGRFKVKGFPVALAISFALLMAYLATVFGLADIVGAFAGGLILAQTKHAHKIFEDMRPIAAIFVSFFFVTLGMRVDLTEMGGNTVAVLLVGVGLTVLAMAAKLACGWGVTKDAQASRLVVGVGMAPRGEVGLIFAALGLSTGLIVNWQYTTVILVVMLTTFITPIWLKKLQDRFFRQGGEGPGSERLEDLSHLLDA